MQFQVFPDLVGAIFNAHTVLTVSLTIVLVTSVLERAKIREIYIYVFWRFIPSTQLPFAIFIVRSTCTQLAGSHGEWLGKYIGTLMPVTYVHVDLTRSMVYSKMLQTIQLMYIL